MWFWKNILASSHGVV